MVPNSEAGPTAHYPHSVATIFPGNPGGLSEIQRHFAREMRYPPTAKLHRVKGQVFVRRLIDSTGHVQEPVVLKSADFLLNEEAIRLMKTLPAWRLARNQGHPAKAEVILPITFTLSPE